MYKLSINRNRGFTLIELLVVVAIVSFLSSIVFSNLGSARMKGRDAKRLSDLHQLNIALNLYYSTNGVYPLCPVGGPPAWSYSTDADWDTTGCLATALQPYINKLPKDPVNNTNSPWNTGNYSYTYRRLLSTDQNYDLIGQIENTNNQNRCEIRRWLFYYYGGTFSWCYAPNPTPYSFYIIADH